MRGWSYMLAGLLVWTAHFAALYLVASVFHTSATIRILSAIATIACLAAAALVLRHGWMRRGQKEGTDERWTHTLAALGGGAALIAILWQGLPAVLI